MFLKSGRIGKKFRVAISREELELLAETELQTEKSWVELMILGGLPNF